jgi:hypothetical protein
MHVRNYYTITFGNKKHVFPKQIQLIAGEFSFRSLNRGSGYFEGRAPFQTPLYKIQPAGHIHSSVQHPSFQGFVDGLQGTPVLKSFVQVQSNK